MSDAAARPVINLLRGRYAPLALEALRAGRALPADLVSEVDASDPPLTA